MPPRSLEWVAGAPVLVDMGALRARFVFLAFVSLSAAISYNAIYLQKGRHPAPMTAEAGKGAAGAARKTTSNPQPANRVVANQAVTGSLPGSDLVRAIQRELAAKGYESGEADGANGMLTRASIMAYQHDKKLPVTGNASNELLEHIVLGGPGAAGGPAPDSHVPAETTALIKGVQQILADLGYEPGPVDGVLGMGTQNAIQAFERERNMPATGRISGKLLRELMRVTGAKPPGSRSG